MKIGLCLGFTDRSETSDVVARKCEELGFESMFTGEHPIIPVVAGALIALGDSVMPEYYERLLDPFISLTVAACATTRLVLGTAVCLAAERDPIILAKEVATLDYYSQGRFILGVGGGWLREETEIMGQDFRRRWIVVREYVRAMKELWTKPEASFQGEFVSFPPVKCWPKPIQQPHTPVYICTGAGPKFDRRLKDTVAVGEGWMPTGLDPERLAEEVAKLKEMCAASGRDFNSIEITILIQAATGPAEAHRQVEEYRKAGATRILFLLTPIPPGQTDRILTPIAEAYLR
ncbi:MAG TPA: LLM class F420-dependent oxidoreductase [Candidatus Binataceae bacterium]|jgi:probable F420-dependent oxidoreductase|nr:LLM class F420-dependent oxidoreductase [Candidatus Binataceae bacterium]